MTDSLMWGSILLNLAGLFLLIYLLKQGSKIDLAKIEAQIKVLEKNQEKTERLLQSEFAISRNEMSLNSRQLREEVLSGMKDAATMQKNQLDIFTAQLAALTQSNEGRLDKMRETVEQKLAVLQEDNNKKLEQMRATVDEKLHATLEKRLGESFQLVSERLEQVHKGLGEMQSLAVGVGDLKKVLTNVKTRGTWGEVQLGSILEQILTPEQFQQNVATKKGSNDRVEFALRLPGKEKGSREVWLPIDAKFPQEDYQRLLEARETAQSLMVEESGKQLEIRIKNEAKNINEKYVNPPDTTDFGIMFLPTEGLYAEVLSRPGLCDFLQRTYRVVVTGPTTLAALVNSLQMGFRTLAIEKRSSEVWNLLGAVKQEFGKFGDILDKTQKKLHEASTTIENAAKKSRFIERKLNKVQELPAEEAAIMLDQEAEPFI